MKKKKFNSQKAKRIAKRVALVLVAALVGGVMGSMVTTNGGIFNRDLNEDNLIKAENYLVKDEDDNDKGITVTVKEDGTIKLNGTAKEDDEYTVAEVVLQPGTYTISGVKSDKDGYGLKAVFGTNEHFAGTKTETFTVTTATTVSIVIYAVEDTFCLNTTIRPVLVAGDEAGEFYA